MSEPRIVVGGTKLHMDDVINTKLHKEDRHRQAECMIEAGEYCALVEHMRRELAEAEDEFYQAAIRHSQGKSGVS